MWNLDHKEGCVLKNWCFQIVMVKKTLETPVDCKEIKSVKPKENQPWIFIGRTDAEAEVSVLCPPDVKSWLTGKDTDAGKDWRQEEKEMTEDEMVGWYHWLNGHEFEQTPGESAGQGSVACCIHGVTKSRTRLSDCTTVKHWTFFSVAVVTIDCLLHFGGLAAAILQHVALLLHCH